jgi:hypothetical protein
MMRKRAKVRGANHQEKAQSDQERFDAQAHRASADWQTVSGQKR